MRTVMRVNMLFAVICVLLLSGSASTAWSAPSEWSALGPSLSGPRDGDVIVNHPPLNTGGLASDTYCYYPYPMISWQRVADDIILSATAVIDEVRWWGFYQEPDPPAEEVMRIRFYQARASDGAPDESSIVYEQSFTNPSRTATGRIVWVDDHHTEYVFDAQLAAPVLFASGLRYWFEVVQVGDVNSTFRWEFSDTNDSPGVAFINPVTVDWRLTAPTFLANNAFELLTIPEPTALGLFLWVLFFTGRRRSR